MKLHKRFVLVVSMISLSLLACQLGGLIPGNAKTVRGSGDVVEENRAVSGVSGVNLATLGHLTIELGDTESLRIEAEDNLMEYIETELRGGLLIIGTQEDIRLDPTRPVNYFLTVTDLDTIVISSSGDIKIANLETDSLEVDINSSGSLDIAGGVVNSQDITISSSGSYTAQDLACNEAEVRINSSGSATIWVIDNLEVILNSSGDLRYRGNPSVNSNTNSSGDVIQLGE